MRNVNYKRVWLYELSRFLYFVVGLLELIFLSGLSIIGERENIQVHVIFFYVFGICGIVHMIANIFCHAHSLYYLNPYVSKFSNNLYIVSPGFWTFWTSDSDSLSFSGHLI